MSARMKDGDILLMHDGEMLRVIEVDAYGGDMTMIESVYEDEIKFVNTKSLRDMYENLGQEGATRALYHATRSIHVRLNKLGQV